ncbi:MAG: (4Fe-4S)-binding protein [Methyloceanibacter sp.]|nr:(4Fe-4S)-binding protein [Methyloceanibacter sp.]
MPGAALVVGGGSREATIQDYRNDKIVVRYDPKICIHAGDCVRGLPKVFDVGKKPWIDVDGASLDAIAAQVRECPSGALSYELLKKKE